MRLFLFILTLFTILSCSKSEEPSCNLDQVDDLVLGTWEVNENGLAIGEVSFLEDGSLIDIEDNLINSIAFGTTANSKSYTISNEKQIVFSAKSASNQWNVIASIDATDCDRIAAQISTKIISLNRLN